jgi:ribosomal protein S18 acetylase RimI-like enzyme
MLRARGFDEAMLGVHGQNPTGAAGVYERAGFRIHRRWSVWRKSMALPGGPLT